MKKIARILLSATTVLTLLIVPVVVHAQEPIIIDNPEATTGLPSTGATETPAPTTPTTPDTGFAPPSSKLAQNVAVFLGGSLLGVGLGFGYISLRNKQSQK